jgi:hypothetical protein
MVYNMIHLIVMKEPGISVISKTTCLVLMVWLFAFSPLKAQEKTERQATTLFQSEEILNLDLAADFKTVFSVKDDSTLFPATISFVDTDGRNKSIDVKIRTRGKTRREKDVCKFTPLRLEFAKKDVANTPFEGQKGLKLVTHCNIQNFYEQNTILEYLIYKAYNVLTDSSFKVRPAMIRYIYPGEEADTIRKFAFFIEREKHLADRLGGIELESEKFNPNLLNPFQSCLMDMFQYMIGNTDYSSYDLHNMILISDSTRRFPPMPVPYDFDWSGLISANYAVPHPVVGTDHVTERVYRGFKKDEFIVYHTIQIFNTRKQEIYQLFENYDLLEAKKKKDVIKYLDGFYEVINNEKKVKTVFFDGARVVGSE